MTDKESKAKLKADEQAALEDQVGRLRTLGGRAANIAADVHEDVLAGKVDPEDTEAEMTAREAA